MQLRTARAKTIRAHVSGPQTTSDCLTISTRCIRRRGKLVRVFLEVFRSLDETHRLFTEGSLTGQMRESLVGTPGPSGLIARYLLTENLSAFLKADPEWAKRHLAEPLLIDDAESILLWRAVTSKWIDTDALKIIGDEALKRVLDVRLGMRTRDSLVFRLVDEALDAFRERREAAVADVRLSQMLRIADDEIRIIAARAIEFYQGQTFETAEGLHTGVVLFRSAVKPFLKQIWPQERSISTPGVSGALSGIPAVAGGAFVEAVDEIERFLTPFDCWSMLCYGFCEHELAETMRMPRLSAAIDDELKANAFLRLLDSTIGDTHDATIPENLSDALGRIEIVAPDLAADTAFRRLSAAARR